MRQHPMQPAEIDRAVQLYESGLSFTNVAEQLPYDASTIWRKLQRTGIPGRDCQGRPR